MFVASHKHGHLKGLNGQGGPLRLQDVLALAEEPLHSSTGGDQRGEFDEELGEEFPPISQHLTCKQCASLGCLCDGTKQSSSGFMFFARYSLKLNFNDLQRILTSELGLTVTKTSR